MSSYEDFLRKAQEFTDGIPFVNIPARAYYKWHRNVHLRNADKVNDSFHRLYDMYKRTDLDAYEWRAKHSNDYLVGTFMRKANARDLYNEQVAMQNDRKRNTGFNWKDNAYPRSAFGSAFGGSVGFANSSPLFDVNKAILELYSGVSKW